MEGARLMGEQMTYNTSLILNAIRDTAQVTKEMHVRNEERLEVLEGQLRKHADILGQYLIKQEAWERLQAEFSGSNSFYVQISTLRMELTRAKEVVAQIQAECANELRSLIEGREKREEDEAQRQREHEKNVSNMRTALISSFSAIALALIQLAMQFFKK
jgi:hypothetical protein